MAMACKRHRAADQGGIPGCGGHHSRSCRRRRPLCRHRVAESFRGKSRVQQHQIVYDALKGEMGGKLHALGAADRHAGAHMTVRES